MSTFGVVMAGCQRLGEVPTGSSLFDLKERAAVAAQKAQHHAEAGDKALARSWANAAKRLRSELQHRLQHTSLGEVGELGLTSEGKKMLKGLIVIGAAVYGTAMYVSLRKQYGPLFQSGKAAERAEET